MRNAIFTTDPTWDKATFLVQHELYTASENCAPRWAQLIADVRAVFGGQVSAAFFGDVLQPAVQTKLGYVRALDWLSVDCYSGPGPLPPVPYGPANYSHPVLPWQDVALATLVAAKRTLLSEYAATAAWAGLKIVCTEVGFQARPWSYSAFSGIEQLDGEDCSVSDQCVSVEAQALAYEAFIAAFYDPANAWFDGALFWLWRADPTAGGLSCDGFGVRGKPAAAVIAEAWGGSGRE